MQPAAIKGFSAYADGACVALAMKGLDQEHKPNINMIEYHIADLVDICGLMIKSAFRNVKSRTHRRRVFFGRHRARRNSNIEAEPQMAFSARNHKWLGKFLDLALQLNRLCLPSLKLRPVGGEGIEELLGFGGDFETEGLSARQRANIIFKWLINEFLPRRFKRFFLRKNHRHFTIAIIFSASHAITKEQIKERIISFAGNNGNFM